MLLGLNTDVDHLGRTYHVQTETLERSELMVRTLVFASGEVLVRMTVSHSALAARAGIDGDDIRHALELQHWSLVRKIQRGMLADRSPESLPEPPVDEAPGAEPVDPSETRRVLHDLDRRIAKAAVRRPPGNTGWWARLRHRLIITLRW